MFGKTLKGLPATISIPTATIFFSNRSNSGAMSDSNRVDEANAKTSRDYAVRVRKFIKVHQSHKKKTTIYATIEDIKNTFETLSR
jgi:hypothetical protein